MIKSKYLKIISIILIICAFIFSCIIVVLSNNINTTTTNNNSAEYTDLLFNESEVSEINIELSDDDWQDMLDNPLEEEYKCGNITINGETIYNVGIRTKGNTSLSQVASSDSNRYSFKVKFDEYVDNQTYYGLDKLNLNNIYADPTYLKEYISYDLFEFMGVTTPNNSFSNISINGESWGLYLAVEGLENSYLTRNYGDDAGNLYKAEGTGTSLVYNGEDQSSYSGLKNNSVKDVSDEDFQKVVDMIKNLNDGTNLEDYIDIDATMRYFAVSSALVNLDSYQCNMFHNYYIYEEDGICTILPWDLNLSFGAFSGGGGGMGNKEQTTNENTAITPDENGNQNSNMTPPNGNMGDNNNQNSNMTPPNGNMGDNNNQDSNMTPPNGNMDDANNQDSNMTPPNGNMGDNNMMTAGGSSASSIIFYPIDEPTSTTMDNSPLLSKLLEVDEYKELYYKYLNEIVENYFNSGTFKEKLYSASSLIDEYVENDSTAFYTYDQFTSSIDELYKLGMYRAEGIEMQLNGEIPKTSSEQSSVDLSTYFTDDPVDTTILGGFGGGGMGGGKMNNKTQLQDDANNNQGGDAEKTNNMPNTTNESSDNDNFLPNTTENSQSQNGGFGGMQGNQNQMPQGGPNGNGEDIKQGGPNGNMGQMQKSNTTENQLSKSNFLSTNSIITLSISLGAIIISIIFVHIYSRRKYKAK